VNDFFFAGFWAGI